MSDCGFGKRIYEEFYLKKKKIVARWDQKDIAVNLGYSENSKGYISRMLNRLESKWGVIKKIKIPSYQNHHLNLYEFGYIDDHGNEVLHFNTVFRKLVVEERLKRFKPDAVVSPEETTRFPDRNPIIEKKLRIEKKTNSSDTAAGIL